jgi:hypothetical protein
LFQLFHPKQKACEQQSIHLDVNKAIFPRETQPKFTVPMLFESKGSIDSVDELEAL